jgi:DNA primase small subunit
VGKTVLLEGSALELVRGEFARYYRGVRVEPPPRFARREFAAFPFAAATMMRRHAAFPRADDLAAFLREEVPRHVYYSSSYYREPDHAVMAQKGWLGADLIFDLDADHLRQAEALDYPGQLRLVKRRFIDLLDDFLFGDLGIDPERTALVFSGGRGYHVHVRDPKFLDLTSAERREIVEYILGEAVDPHRALRGELARDSSALELHEGEGAAPGRRGRAAPRTFQRLADPKEPGWPGRVSRSVLELVGRWEGLGVDGTTEELIAMGLKPEAARKIARQLLEHGGARQMREQLTLEVFHGPVPEPFLEAVLRRARIEVQGETDAPVTTDIHRLIRLPGSLHGGSGLVVRPLGRDALDAFEPLRDAIPPRSAQGPVRVRATAPFRYPFGEGTLSAAEGERLDLPREEAVFLLLRGEAELTPPASG